LPTRSKCDGAIKTTLGGVSDPSFPPVVVEDEGATRPMGRRGQRTRQRLLDSTAELLRSSTYREVRVVDIARAAGMSPAAFYQYFGDVEEAVLALAEEMVEACGPELAALVAEQPWDGPAAWSSALGVAEGFLDVWDRHRAVLRVVDLATDEGDRRFRDLRTRFLNAPSEALVGILAARRTPSGADPRAEAGVAISMLAHVAAHHEGLEQWGAPADDLRRSMARSLYVTVTGQLPPSRDQASGSSG
jgi:AcrR family transcriptional regulator